MSDDDWDYPKIRLWASFAAGYAIVGLVVYGWGMNHFPDLECHVYDQTQQVCGYDYGKVANSVASGIFWPVALLGRVATLVTAHP